MIKGWSLDDSVLVAPNGSKIDLGALKDTEPSFDWTGFLEALATVLTPLPPGNEIELQSAITGLQAVTTALQTLAKGTS